MKSCWPTFLVLVIFVIYKSLSYFVVIKTITPYKNTSKKHPGSVDLITTKQNKPPSFIDRYMIETLGALYVNWILATIEAMQLWNASKALIYYWSPYDKNCKLGTKSYVDFLIKYLFQLQVYWLHYFKLYSQICINVILN